MLILILSAADANRFGTKMLEKMGWSKGKGLGTNEDGEQNFIRVSHKTDQKGIGFQDRDDQWTGHENQFNTLLESLNNSRNPSDDDDSKSPCDDELDGAARSGFGFESSGKKSEKSIKAKLSGKSLEELSKKSSVRVHYRKFTRGKDISKYSEKDLANIFGKKCVNGDVVENTDEEPPAKDESDNRVAHNYGITTIETGTSVQDYFKMKKRKKELSDAGAGGGGGGEGATNASAENTDGCENKRRKKDKQTNAEQNAIETIENEASSDEIKTAEKKKKKKKSKPESTVEEPEPDMETNTVAEDDCEILSTKTKKKKRKDKKNVENVESTWDETTPAVIDAHVDENDAEADADAETVAKKKKKKKEKKRDKKCTSDVISACSDTEEVNTIESKPITNTQFIDGILDVLVNHSAHSSTASVKQANSQHEASQAPPAPASTYTPATNIAMDRVFEINRYHAEMFRFVDLDGFPNSNLSELNGYGYSKDIELQISEKSKDQTKINDLWDCALVNKYGKDVIQTKKAKKSKQYSIGKLRKKNLFREL